MIQEIISKIKSEVEKHLTSIMNFFKIETKKQKKERMQKEEFEANRLRLKEEREQRAIEEAAKRAKEEHQRKLKEEQEYEDLVAETKKSIELSCIEMLNNWTVKNEQQRQKSIEQLTTMFGEEHLYVTEETIEELISSQKQRWQRKNKKNRQEREEERKENKENYKESFESYEGWINKNFIGLLKEWEQKEIEREESFLLEEETAFKDYSKRIARENVSFIDDLFLNIADISDDEADELRQIYGEYDPTYDLSTYDFPRPEFTKFATSEDFQNSTFEFPISLGNLEDSFPYIIDISENNCWFLSGSEKSSILHSILVSLIYKKHPAEVKFVIFNSKTPVLNEYRKIEHHFLAKSLDLEGAIITDTSKLVNTLNSLCIEMDMRYELLKEAQVRTIKEYNAKFIQRHLNPEKGHRYLPRIIILIDEINFTTEVTTPLFQLILKSECVGIHLIIGINETGTNELNLEALFQASLNIQFKNNDTKVNIPCEETKLISIQDISIIDSKSIEEICEFIGSQRGYPEAFALPESVSYKIEEIVSVPKTDIDDIDPMFAEAARIIVISQLGSASVLQRELKLGYNHAARIVDQLGAYGIIGLHQGSKPRGVFFSDIDELEEYLHSKGIY